MTEVETEYVKLKSKQEDLFEVETRRRVPLHHHQEHGRGHGPSTYTCRCRWWTRRRLVKVIEYLKYHQQAEEETIPEDEQTRWDKDYIKVDDETLFNTILAANYLDIKPLLDLTCKAVADEIKGKSPEEIRLRFNIKNDFTPEEEEEVKRENAWCEER